MIPAANKGIVDKPQQSFRGYKCGETQEHSAGEESLTNVHRHAQCTECRVQLDRSDGLVTLEINDNGKGLDRIRHEQKFESFSGARPFCC